MDDLGIPTGLLAAVREGRRMDMIRYIGSSDFSTPHSWNRGWLLLREAVKYNQLKTVRLLLNYKVPVNNPDREKCTSRLHLGVGANNQRVTRSMSAKKCKVNAKYTKYFNPLRLALKEGRDKLFSLLFLKGCKISDSGELLLEVIRRNKYKSVNFLLKHGTPVNYISKKSNSTPLQCALNYRFWKIVRLLVKRGADVNEVDKFGKTILFYAIEHKKTTMVLEILKAGVNVNTIDKFGDSPLHLAFKTDCDEYFEMLMQYGADIYAHDYKNATLLSYAVADLKPNKVKMILKYRTEYSEDQKMYCLYFLFDIFFRHHNFTILCQQLSDYKETLEVLLDHGFSVVNYVERYRISERIILIGVLIDSLKLVEHFLNGGGVIVWSEFDESPLASACEMNSITMAKLLLKAGADPNFQSHSKPPPVIYAVRNENYELTKLLLNVECNYSIADLFYYAVVTGSEEILKFLFEYKPDFNTDCIDREKGSLSNIATWWGSESIMRILLDRDISTSTRDINGDTPLHCACAGRREECIKLLLSNSLDTHVRNIDGLTPLQCYRKSNPFEETHSDILVNHILKLYYAGFFVDADDLAYVLQCPHDRLMHINEVNLLKERKIGKLSISYYDILHDDIDRVARYLRNKYVQTDFFLEQFKLFPLYSGFLETKYRIAHRRRILLDKGYDFFCLNIPTIVVLPNEIIEKILSYLNNEELRFFMGETSGDKVVSFKDLRPYCDHND